MGGFRVVYLELCKGKSRGTGLIMFDDGICRDRRRRCVVTRECEGEMFAHRESPK